jgi:hypothetical protein
MNWGGPGFVILIIAISIGGWLVNNWIRAKHGYPLEDEWGGKTEPRDSGEVNRLREENSRLIDRLQASEDRLAVLEKIVTDRGYSLADEIEALRGKDSGAALNLGNEEKAR